MQNFRTLGQPLLGEKFVTRKRKKERKIIPLLRPNILLGLPGLCMIDPTLGPPSTPAVFLRLKICNRSLVFGQCSLFVELYYI
jgi:hypothetical protein